MNTFLKNIEQHGIDIYIKRKIYKMQCNIFEKNCVCFNIDISKRIKFDFGCMNGHEWKTTYEQFKMDKGCPFCKSSNNYIYIIQPRSSIEGKLNVYKIGKTDRIIIKRLHEYEKGSQLKLCIQVDDCSLTESSLLFFLKHIYKQRLDFGKEYFEGEYIELRNSVLQHCCGIICKPKLNPEKSKNTLVNDNEIIKLKELYKRGLIGNVDIYYNKIKDNLISLSKEKCKFYLYDENKKLWIQKKSLEILDHFSINIKLCIDPLIKYYCSKKYKVIQMGHINKIKKYTNYINTLNKCHIIDSPSRIKLLTSLIQNKFYNDSVSLNNNKNLLPIKEGVFDLTLKTIRDRTKYDYFSYVLNDTWKNNEMHKIISNDTIDQNISYQMTFNILEWLDKYYIKTKNKKDYIKLKDMYSHFKNSEYFFKLTKQKKREYNYQYFVKQISDNEKFIGCYFIKFNIYTNVLVYYKKK